MVVDPHGGALHVLELDDDASLRNPVERHHTRRASEAE